MNTTKVNKSALLDKLRENREAHKAEFENAREIWENKVIDRLLEVRDEAIDGMWDNVRNPLADLPTPTQFLKQYDIAISQLEWETEDTVELDEQEFSYYVLNDWAWKSTFVASTSIYNSSV